nr:NADH-quinone oxidoreductase subunit H [Angustibacter aerolatus]
MLDAVLHTVVVLVAFLVLPLVVGQAEHKVMAHMQGRLGPMYAGGFHGWAQAVADGVKFVQKEDVVPAAADRRVFGLAPGVALVPYLVAMAAVPLAPGVVGADLDAGLLFVLAVSALGVLGTLMAGWASANKYALLGGLRTAAQPAVVRACRSCSPPPAWRSPPAPCGSAGSSTRGTGGGWCGVPALVCFVVAGVAERPGRRSTCRSPTASLVFGPYTEYTGLRFAFFLLSEYAGIVLLAALTAVLFLGGWRGPGPDGAWWTLLKTGLVSLVIIWVRVAWPRVREDQRRRWPGRCWCRWRCCARDHGRAGGGDRMSAKKPLSGLLQGLATTARTMTKHAHTQEYPDVQPEPPPRSRGVIALLEENCTVCMLCARECPDWCITIDSHKETLPAAAPGGRERQRNVLDRFDIDFSLCMYCSICIEVCPFDALHWSPEFEYAEARHPRPAARQGPARRVDADRAAAARARPRRPRAEGGRGRAEAGSPRPAAASRRRAARRPGRTAVRSAVRSRAAGEA